MWQGGSQRRSHSKTTFPEMQKPNGETRLDVLNVLDDVDICCATFKSILTMLWSITTDESAMTHLRWWDAGAGPCFFNAINWSACLVLNDAFRHCSFSKLLGDRTGNSIPILFAGSLLLETWSWTRQGICLGSDPSQAVHTNRTQCCKIFRGSKVSKDTRSRVSTAFWNHNWLNWQCW